MYRTMCEEIFGPVLTVHVYPAAKWSETLALVDRTGPYALTGAVFAQDRAAIAEADRALRYAAGNYYVNDKPTGAVVGQQPFGGARASGTNDKAGSVLNLLRWVSPARDQGDVRAAEGLPLSVHGGGVSCSGATSSRAQRGTCSCKVPRCARDAVPGVQDAFSTEHPDYTAAQLHCARFARDLPQRHRDRDRRPAPCRRPRSGAASGAFAPATRPAASRWRRGTTRSRSAAAPADAEISADTDGLIGGRYRGLLTAAGAYIGARAPVRARRSRRGRRSLRRRATICCRRSLRRPLRPGESWNDAGARPRATARHQSWPAARCCTPAGVPDRSQTRRFPAATPCRSRCARRRSSEGGHLLVTGRGSGAPHSRTHHRSHDALRRAHPAARALARGAARRAHPPAGSHGSCL